MFPVISFPIYIPVIIYCEHIKSANNRIVLFENFLILFLLTLFMKKTSFPNFYITHLLYYNIFLHLCKLFLIFYYITSVGLSNICHTFLEINIIEIPCMIHKLYIVINSKYFSFGLFHSNGFIGKLLYSLDQYLSFSLKSSKLTNTLL